MGYYLRVKTINIDINEDIKGHDTIYYIYKLVNDILNCVIYKEENENICKLSIPFIDTGISAELIYKDYSDVFKVDDAIKLDYTNCVISSKSPHGINISNNKKCMELFNQLKTHECTDEELNILRLFNNMKCCETIKNKDNSIVKTLRISKKLTEAVIEMNDYINEFIDVGLRVDFSNTSDNILIPYIEEGNEVYMFNTVYNNKLKITKLDVPLLLVSGLLQKLNYKQLNKFDNLFIFNLNIEIKG